MDIPMVPFEGRMSYCLIRSLAMVLAHQGHEYPVPWLECVSGEPFGFAYVRDHQQFFAIDGYVYHVAGQHLLRTLNFDFSFTGSADIVGNTFGHYEMHKPWMAAIAEER